MKDKKWSAENIGDLSGKIAIVTGSSSGIGFETARVLAKNGAKVIIAVRNMEKGASARQRIREGHESADIRLMELDLADLVSVRKFVSEFKQKFQRLDILINNAGVMMPPYSKTEDGFELQFGTNHLGHFALTAGLFDLLAKSPGSRVVNVSSNAHKSGNIDFDDLNWEERSYSSWRAYGASKIANLYFTKEINRKIKESGLEITVTSAHPGWTATDLQRHSGVVEFLNSFFAQDISMGALPTIRAALEEGLDGGEYFGPGGFLQMRGYPVRVEPNDLAKDDEIAKKLWMVSEELTGARFEGLGG